MPSSQGPSHGDAVPLLREQLEVQPRTVETGTVRIETRVVETEQRVELPLRHDRAEVVRVPIDRVVDRAEPPRRDGETTIVPIYEEVLVVTKQLVLKEELHIRVRSTVEPGAPQLHTLRHEEVAVRREPPQGPSTAPSGPPIAGSGR